MRYILAMKKNLTFLLVAALSATAVAEEAESEAIVEIVQPSTLDELLKNIVFAPFVFSQLTGSKPPINCMSFC